MSSVASSPEKSTALTIQSPEEQNVILRKKLDGIKAIANRDSELLAQVQKQNLQLLARQADEKQVRAQLSTAVQMLRKENNVLQGDVTSLKELSANLEANLHIEIDSFNQERDEWKKQQIKAIRKFEKEIDGARILRERADQLANTLAIVSDEKEQAANERDNLRRQLEGSRPISRTSRGSDVPEQPSRPLSVAGPPPDKAAEVKKQQQAEQLRKMAEKVFALVSQINKMEEWKENHLEIERKAKVKINTLESQAIQMTGAMKQAARKRDKVEAGNRLLQEKLMKQQRIVMQIKQDQHLLEKERHSLNKSLRSKTNQLQQSTGRSDALSHRLLQEQQSRAIEREAATSMQHDLTELAEHNKLLRIKLDQIDSEKLKLQKLCVKQQGDLVAWESRQAYFDNLQV